MAGTGIGGGAGLWLPTISMHRCRALHYQLCLAFALIVLSLRDIEHQTEKTLKQELSGLGKDLLSMIKVPVTLFAIILVLVPIGTGAMANLWSAMAEDWKVDADTVALITGLLSGLISSLGCVAGGYLADRRGIWFAYLGSGVACALVTIVMAVMPMQSTIYIAGVLFYAFTMGMIYAAFTSGNILFRNLMDDAIMLTENFDLWVLLVIFLLYMKSLTVGCMIKSNSKIMLMALLNYI
ncbi:MAG: MFS transporter [Bacteroidetes bacterium]|nr:MFS transporter [Bacteroidota bacterium]